MKDIHDRHLAQLAAAQEAHNAAIGEAARAYNEGINAANAAYSDAVQASREDMAAAIGARLANWNGETVPGQGIPPQLTTAQEAALRQALSGDEPRRLAEVA